MALSSVSYVGNGSTTQYALTFLYISVDDITVNVDGSPVSFTWDNPAQVNLDAAPEQDAVIFIFRETENETRLVDFTAASILDEASLDKDSNQLFYTMQEARDDLANALPYDPNTLEWDAENLRIKNLDDGVSDDEAVNVGQMAPFVTDCETAQTAAEVAQAAAETAQTAAELAETNAETAETNAETAETAAELAETNAETAQTAAELAEDGCDADLVLTNADVVLTGLDLVDTNADVVLTGLDLVDTNADVVLCDTAVTAAELAETNAETAETNAETAETNAAASAAAALVSEGLASDSETAAELAETNAETAETNAETAQAAAEAVTPTISDDSPSGGIDGDVWYEY